MSQLQQPCRRFAASFWTFLCGCALVALLPLPGATQEKASLTSLINAYLKQNKDLRTINPAKHQKIKDDLLKGIRQALGDAKDPRELYAVTVLIGELAEKEYRRVEDRLINDEDEKVVRGLTPDLVALADNPDWRVRYVVMRTLGKITPPPEKAVPVFRAALTKTGSNPEDLEPRRVAAYALVELTRFGHAPIIPETPFGKNLIPVPLEQMKIISLVLDAADIGLRDSDELVRGYSLLALIEAVNSLHTYLLPHKVSDRFEDKRFEDLLSIKPFRTEFVTIFSKLEAINTPLLADLLDPSVRVRITALEAIEDLASARADFVQYLREKSNQPTGDPRQLFKSLKVEDQVIEVKDPMQKIVNVDRGQTIIRLLDFPDDGLKLHRKAMGVLELLGPDVHLVTGNAGSPVLKRLAQVLADPRAGNFVRWSAVNIVHKLTQSESEPDRAKPILRAIFADNIDAALCNILLQHQTVITDPNLAKASAYALEGLGELSRDAEASRADRKRLGAEFTAVLQHVFFLQRDGLVVYDRTGSRYDVDTRRAVLRALVILGPDDAAGSVDVAIVALEQDPDPRIRREAAKALGRFGRAAEKAIPALIQALRLDEDTEVRMDISETYITFSKLKRLP